MLSLSVPDHPPAADAPAAAPPAPAGTAATAPQLRAHKNARTLMLGPSMRLLFEDALTLEHHLHQLARAEDLRDAAALARERAAYAHLLPHGRSWHATLMIELPDAAQRRRELPPLNDAVHALYVDLPRLSRVRVEANEDQPDRHRRRLSAVHFLRFGFRDAERRALLQPGSVAVIGCEHPAYAWRRLLPARVLALLRADLAPFGP